MPEQIAIQPRPPAPVPTPPRRDSTLVNRNVWIQRRRTSLRLEPAMWEALEEVAQHCGTTIHEVCTLVAEQRRASSLTAEIRACLVEYYRAAAEKGAPRFGKGLLMRVLGGEAPAYCEPVEKSGQ